MTQNIVLAVGTGRCGTATLAHIFKQLEGVRALHEPRPSLARIAAFSMKRESYDFQKALKHARGDLLGDHVLESSLWNTWLIEEFVGLWPQIKFIWLTRNVFDWARSAYRRGWYHPHTEQSSGAIGMLRVSPASGWPNEVNRWFKLGYMYARYTHHIVTSFRKVGVPWIHVNVTDLNNLAFVNTLVKWCGFPGEVTELTRANSGDTRVTVEELKMRGLFEKATKAGLRIGADTHPYAWTYASELSRILKQEIKYEHTYHFTPEVVRDIKEGMAYHEK